MCLAPPLISDKSSGSWGFGTLKSAFEEPSSTYISGSQSARVRTERWVSDWMYCINCGEPSLSQFPNNSPVADFFCPNCQDQFEVKSTKKAIGTRVADGAYFTKIERLQSATNPNLLLIGYDAAANSVSNVCVVPKHFFTTEIIEKRRPLAATARRAGWIGSNILLGKVPEAGRIYVFRDGMALSKESVLSKWQQTLFLRETGGSARGWLIEVMKAVEAIGRTDFSLEDVYAFERHFSSLYPDNNNVRPKIRQQLQVLRDNGYLEFTSRGQYRLTKVS